MQEKKVLASDIGGIIIPLKINKNGQFIFFTEGYSDLLPIEESIQALRRVAEVLGVENVYLLSGWEPNLEGRLLTWLRYHHVFTKVGILESQLLVPKDKVKICRELGVTDYINDKQGELDALRSVVPRRHLFNPDNPVRSWERILLSFFR